MDFPGAMRHSLQSHIAYLQKLIQNLTARLAEPGLAPEEVEDCELQLALSESALEHYRQAYELELTVSNPDPPAHPSGSESGENGAPGNPRRGNIKERLAALRERYRKARGAAKRFAPSPVPAVRTVALGR